MQKFKKGDKVEVRGISGATKYVSDGLYEGKSIVSTCTGKLLHVTTTHIRTAQLICDEAREKIGKKINVREGYCYKVECDSREENEELYSLNTTWLYVHNRYNTSPDERTVFNDKQLPELNLKTGEVIPFVDVRTREDVIVDDSPRIKNITVGDLKKEVVSNVVKEVNAQLLLIERDKEIVELKERIDILEEANEYNVGSVKEKDAEIEQLKTICNCIREVLNKETNIIIQSKLF